MGWETETPHKRELSRQRRTQKHGGRGAGNVEEHSKDNQDGAEGGARGDDEQKEGKASGRRSGKRPTHVGTSTSGR